MDEPDETIAQPLDDIDALMHQLERLPIGAPPMLAAACGYAGEERYVAFFSEDCGGRDNLHYDDGLRGARGDFMAWLIWRNHMCVYPHLVSYEFAAPEFSGRPGRHCLLVDRSTLSLYVGTRAAVARFLRDQVRGRLPVGPLVIEDTSGEFITADPDDAAAMQRFGMAMERRIRESMRALSNKDYRRRVEQIQAEMASEARLCTDLQAWLDSQITEQTRVAYEAALRAEYERILADLFSHGPANGDAGP